VDGVNCTFDANGNLLSDCVNTYTYDSANRLNSVNGTESYTYNGLGDRLTQNGVHYTLDLNSGLTQVLDDGTNTYVYGLGRIAQTGTTTEYFLGDALGSVRQLTNSTGTVTLAKSYDPYGTVTHTNGAAQSAYGFTGEMADVTGLTYLRARYYSPLDGRFMSRDTWEGDYNHPITLGKWIYANSNPITYSDPTGYSAVVNYDRDAAVNYAVKYAVHENTSYIRFDADCTNFVSQALQAGGLIQEKDWKYTPGGGTAWMLTDKFYDYFVKTMGFSHIEIPGSVPPKEAPDNTKKPERYSAFGYNKFQPVIPNPLQMETYGNFDFLSYGIREGDIVLYHQIHSAHVIGGGDYNHAAFILNPSVQLTDRYNGKFLNHSAPYIAEHSGGYEEYNGGSSATNNIHSINDTWSEVHSMMIIHIPDVIVYPGPICPGGG